MFFLLGGLLYGLRQELIAFQFGQIKKLCFLRLLKKVLSGDISYNDTNNRVVIMNECRHKVREDLKMPQSGLGSMKGSTEGCLSLKVVFHRRSSSTDGRIPPQAMFR